MTHQQFPSSPTNALSPLAQIQVLGDPFFNPKSGHIAHTAPNSPLRLSPINNINITPTNTRTIQPSNKVRLSMPPRANTEACDIEKYDQESLFSVRVQTDPGEGEEPVEYQSHVSRKKQYDDMKRKTSLQNLQSLIDDIKKAGHNNSYNIDKVSKSPKAESQPPIRWPKEISTISEKSGKNPRKSRKRPQSSNERLNESNGDSTSKSEKKPAKTPIKDLELDLEMDERFATEGESPEGLFEDMLIDREVHSCKNSRDTGPLRYSKMSEEDAANIFEKRRKQLLSFLFKLGANSAVVKKKLFTKKPLMPKQGNFLNNSPDIQKYESILDKEMRSVKDTLRPSASPNTFIIYNNKTTEGGWNGISQARLGTPARENNKIKRHPSSIKAGSDSASDAKRRNSLKATKEKEKEDANAAVKRNLESSFNKIAQDWQEANEGRGFRRLQAKAETFTGSVDEKKDVFENIKIDLKRVVSKKKKKKRTGITQIQLQVPEQEPVVSLDKIMIQKRTSEDLGLLMNRNRDLAETKEERKVNMELINHMRKKNKAVLSDIEEIDVQIKKMEAERQLRERKKKSMERSRDARGRKDDRGRKDEGKRVEILGEFLQESYASAARARRSKERPKSMGFKNYLMDVTKQPKNAWEENSRTNANQLDSKRQDQERSAAKNDQREKNKRMIKPKFTSDIEGRVNNDRWPRSPQSFHDRSTNDWNIENEARKKDKKGHQKSLIRDIPISRVVPMPSSAPKSPQRSRRNVEDLTMQSLDLGKGMEQNLNAKAIQSATIKRPEKESPSLNNLKTTLKQHNRKPTKDENEKDYKKVQSTASTLHSFRNAAGGYAGSTNDDLFSSGKGQGNATEKIKSRVSENSKAMNAPKKMQRYPLNTKSRKSLEGNYNAMDLFEGTTNVKSAKKLPIKISFFDEVKKILREGGPDGQKTPLSIKDKMDTSKSTIKSTKEEPQNVKREVINRPKTDSVSSLDIRTKLLKEGRPLEDLKKSSKFLNAPGINNAKSRKELSKKPSMELGPKSQTNLNRKASETTSQGLDNTSFPSNVKTYVNNLLDGDSERTERLLTSERHGIDSSTSIAASDKFDRKASELTGQINTAAKGPQVGRQSKQNSFKDAPASNKKKI